MPRFVILHHHQIEAPHWDLMLEHKKVLATWRIHTDPESWLAGPIDCTKSFDHRKQYLDFQGQLTKNRGQVDRFDQGHYQAIEIKPDHWQVKIQSEEITAHLSLVQIKDDQWQLILESGLEEGL